MSLAWGPCRPVLAENGKSRGQCPSQSVHLLPGEFEPCRRVQPGPVHFLRTGTVRSLAWMLRELRQGLEVADRGRYADVFGFTTTRRIFTSLRGWCGSGASLGLAGTFEILFTTSS